MKTSFRSIKILMDIILDGKSEKHDWKVLRISAILVKIPSLACWRSASSPLRVPQQKTGRLGTGDILHDIGWRILTHTSAWNWELNCYISSHNNTRQEKTKHQKILKMLKPLSRLSKLSQTVQIVPILDCHSFVNRYPFSLFLLPHFKERIGKVWAGRDVLAAWSRVCRCWERSKSHMSSGITCYSNPPKGR